ncbi:cupredoxin domain-containing protein [Candidatus Parcubacteria bacterium]|nr:cupredoxin domain-containing protein [Candidatus Parcubacteria bacterium]
MKAIITIIILALIGWGIYAVVKKSPNDNVQIPINNTQEDTSNTTASTTTDNTPSVKEFTVVGKSFSFTPSTLTVKKGDTVRINFQNSGGQHDWRLDEFNAKTKVIGSGQSETIEFVADKTGSFEYYCSVGTHRQMGMRGTLTVE